MPLKKCKKDGKSGWQWGDAGKCYVGPGAKKKAIKQGVAIEGPAKFKKEAAKGGEDAALIREALAEAYPQPTYTETLIENVKANLADDTSQET